MELRCVGVNCRHDFAVENPFRSLGDTVKCPLCGALCRISGEDSDEGFCFYMELGDVHDTVVCLTGD